MKVHFISIGGSAMHSLAITLKYKGYEVSGSDDEIFEPSRSRLENHGLLPSEYGWFPEKVDSTIDAVILGMHAKKDNPELQKAIELGTRIFSYPEYIFEESKNKKRVVIGGSHGKTTITAMILHVLNHCGMNTDYLIGAPVKGLPDTVKISSDANLMVIEGDEYLTSPLDPRPKFHWYKPDIAVLTGIAWDHMNVFPTFEDYLKQFEIFIQLLPENASLIYSSDDRNLKKVIDRSGRCDLNLIKYSAHPGILQNGTFLLIHRDEYIPVKVFGKHNMYNLSAAKHVCGLLGITNTDFYDAIASFEGARNRLEKIGGNNQFVVYKDFAHAPSKVKATVDAVRELYPDRNIVACFELHTYSSLNIEFLPQYSGTLSSADEALIYFNPHALEIKKLPMLQQAEIADAFGYEKLQVFSDSRLLHQKLTEMKWDDSVLLLMSSGNFDNINLVDLAKDLSGL